MSTPTTPPHATLQLPQSTPFKTGSPTTYPYTTTQKYRIPARSALADEIGPYLIGPMPAQQFLDDFFPVGDIPDLDSVPDFTSGCYDSTVEAEKETLAYKPFVETTATFTPGLQVVNSSEFNDRNPRLDFPFRIKPDISVYHSDSPISIMTDSSLAEIFIEFKWQTSDDPFCLVPDHPNARSFFRQSKAARDTLGQITSYAVAQLGSQFRTHLYSVFVVKDIARLLRWDRSGTIVTEAIEYNNSPCLVEFFRRYSKAPPEMCGKDQSVSAVTPMEADLARQALQLDNEIPLFKLAIPVANQPSRYFITHAPRATLYPPPGRATRGFRAYDILQGTKVFLKDSWRIDLRNIHAEGSIYKVLESSGVQHIPRCLVSGDISTDKYHSTKADIYCSSDWACSSGTGPIPHRHYRLVLDVIGDSLTKFSSSYEMVAAIRDALVAHKDAWEAGILHRDISPGNIIIGPDRRGLLIDWDMSKPVKQEDEKESPRRVGRTGTWQFMSASLVGGCQTQDYRDDLESSLYTLLWVTVMYSQCPDPDRVSSLLNTVFEPHHTGPKVTDAKEDFLKGHSFLKKKHFPKLPVLLRLLIKLSKLFATRYVDESSDAQETEDGNSSPSTTISLSEYHERMSGLKDHTATIKLFDAALEDRSQWPPNDAAVKQQYHSPTKANEQELKSGYDTTRFVDLVKKNADEMEE